MLLSVGRPWVSVSQDLWDCNLAPPGTDHSPKPRSLEFARCHNRGRMTHPSKRRLCQFVEHLVPAFLGQLIGLHPAGVVVDTNEQLVQ